MASTTTKNSDNKNNNDSLHNTIERLGIRFASGQHGGVPLSVPVDASQLQLLVQELQRIRDWNNIPHRKAAELARKIQNTKDNENSEFAEWS